MTNFKSTDITLVIDASPSMIPQTKETIKGVNEFVHAQVVAAADADQSVSFELNTFSNYSARVEGQLLTTQNYRPELGNGTALYDAVGQAIKVTGGRLRALPEARRPGKVLFVIVTDGEENVSRTYTREMVRDMIKHQIDEYKWDFVFMGANQDAWAVGAGLGFHAGKTMAYAGNDQGTQAAWASASSYATRSVGAINAQGFCSNNINPLDLANQVKAGLDVSGLAVPDALKASVKNVKDDGHEVTV